MIKCHSWCLFMSFVQSIKSQNLFKNFDWHENWKFIFCKILFKHWVVDKVVCLFFGFTHFKSIWSSNKFVFQILRNHLKNIDCIECLSQVKQNFRNNGRWSNRINGIVLWSVIFSLIFIFYVYWWHYKQFFQNKID